MGKRLKIAMISPGTFPLSGGKTSSIEMLMKKLASVFQNEADVFMFGKKFKNQPDIETKGSITFYRFSSSGKTYINRCIEKLQEIESDIIHIENRPRFARAMRLALPNAKIVLALQSTLFMSRPHISRSELKTCLDAADAIVVNSHFLKNHMIKDSLCPASKITVNHLGADINQFQPKWLQEQKEKGEQLKKMWGISDKKILLYAGRLIKIKGVHYILEAMPELIKIDPSIVLIIAGSSLSPNSENLAYEAHLRELAEKVKGHVIFASFITHNQIHNWYQIADILLVPSEAEPFGLVNVEAMAVGTPVIGTNSGGIPEIIQHKKTGILINPERVVQELTWQILKLFSNPEKMKKLGLASALHVRAHFTWEHTAHRQLALYQELLEKS